MVIGPVFVHVILISPDTMAIRYVKNSASNKCCHITNFLRRFLFGSCFGEIYDIVRDGDSVSAIPYEGSSDCQPIHTFGLHYASK